MVNFDSRTKTILFGIYHGTLKQSAVKMNTLIDLAFVLGITSQEVSASLELLHKAGCIFIDNASEISMMTTGRMLVGMLMTV